MAKRKIGGIVVPMSGHPGAMVRIGPAPNPEMEAPLSREQRHHREEMHRSNVEWAKKFREEMDALGE